LLLQVTNRSPAAIAGHARDGRVASAPARGAESRSAGFVRFAAGSAAFVSCVRGLAAGFWLMRPERRQSFRNRSSGTVGGHEAGRRDPPGAGAAPDRIRALPRQHPRAARSVRGPAGRLDRRLPVLGPGADPLRPGRRRRDVVGAAGPPTAYWEAFAVFGADVNSASTSILIVSPTISPPVSMAAFQRRFHSKRLSCPVSVTPIRSFP